MENKQHVAIRTCIATSEKKDKKDMIRLVKTPDGKIIVDLKGKAKGRGANITADMNALEIALKKKAIERALKLKGKLDDEVVSLLRKDFESALNEKNLRGGNKKITIKVSKEDFDKIK